MSIYKTNDKTHSLSHLVLAIRFSSRLRHTLTLSIYLSLFLLSPIPTRGFRYKKEEEKKEKENALVSVPTGRKRTTLIVKRARSKFERVKGIRSLR